jgi:hypothetical protein
VSTQNSSARRFRTYSAAVLLTLAVLLWVVLRFLPRERDELFISLKRYGRTIEGEPVAWLTLSNASNGSISLLAHPDPVPTAICEYEQIILNTSTAWTHSAVQPRGTMRLGPADSMSIRVLLPTNDLPTRVRLLAFIERNSPWQKQLRPIRSWCYRHGLLSPLRKISVPVELKPTNITTRYVH